MTFGPPGSFVIWVGQLKRVAADFKMPNGIIGTLDGKHLYVADHSGRKTYRFDIQEDGSLTNRVLFAEEGSDGMTVDNKGNVYLTYGSAVIIFDKEGNKLGELELPERPSNVTFAGKKKDMLFITAQTSVYRVDMRTEGD
jgi:gluconolactonase